MILAGGREGDRLFNSVTVWDPAVDWVCDDVRRWLFFGTGINKRVAKGEYPMMEMFEDGWKGVFGGVDGLRKLPQCWMYCSNWCDDHPLRMATCASANGDSRNFPKGSKGLVIKDCRHFEFADNCLIQPRWLSRALGFCGGDPEVTCRDIRTKTLEFLQKVS